MARKEESARAGQLGQGGPCLRWEEAESYLDRLAAQGRTAATIQAYRHNLRLFFQWLPQEGRIDHGTLARWRSALLEQGYQPRTVNVRLSAANGFMDYLGLRDYQLPVQLRPAEDDIQPEIARGEYLRLLSAARALGKERAYFLVKTFAVTGLAVHDLPQLTAESVWNGRIVLEGRQPEEAVQIPDDLRRELTGYLQRAAIRSGPVFITRSGKRLSRTAVTAEIQSLARSARVAPEKCNPRCLRKLCQATREDIERNISFLVEQALNRLLEQEQIAVGWEEVSDHA